MERRRSRTYLLVWMDTVHRDRHGLEVNSEYHTQ
jgi:hypothetical protein